jgi:hypothetical protein
MTDDPLSRTDRNQQAQRADVVHVDFFTRRADQVIAKTKEPQPAVVGW